MLGLLLAGAAAGCWFGVAAVHQRFSTRTISVCVLTDFEYRVEKPDWQSRLKPLFEEVNRMFQKTGVQWQAKDGGEAYPPEARGSMLHRATLLQNRPGCQADIILGLTGRPDANLSSVVPGFSHTLLVQDSAANSPAMTATLLARALANLFGVPASTQALILTDASPGGVFDAAAIGIIRGMRDYDFARGMAAFPGRWEKRAAGVLEESLAAKEARPGAQAHVIIGRAFGAARRYEDAVRHLREAVRLDPQNSRLHFELAMSLESESESVEAIAELKTAAGLDPANAWPYAAMGAIHLNAHRVDQAIDELRTATRIDPHNAGYQAALGQALSQQPGRTREASAAFEAAVRLRASEPGALAGIMREAGLGQTLQQAVRQLQADVSQKPGSAEAHLKLGVAHAQAGNSEAARTEIQRALQIEPGNGRAHVALARLNYLTGQYAAAASELGAARAAGERPNAEFVDAVNRKLTPAAVPGP